jgi:hypothetical protein
MQKSTNLGVNSNSAIKKFSAFTAPKISIPYRQALFMGWTVSSFQKTEILLNKK